MSDLKTNASMIDSAKRIKPKRVSVIVPAYNRVEFIEQTIDSVLIQDYEDIELIVVDDGSSDGTYEKLIEYQRRGKIQLLYHPRHSNRGQSAAINLGLRACSGEFVCILDSDDIFASAKISRQVAYLQKHKNIGLVYGNGKAIDAQNNELYTLHSDTHIEANDPNKILLDCYFCLPVNALVRMDVYKRVGEFEERFRAAQDHDMQLRIAEVTRLAYIPEILFYYRKHRGSISCNGQISRWRNGFEILRRAQARYPYRQSTLRKRKAVLNYRLARAYLVSGAYWLSVRCFVSSAWLDPWRAMAVITGIDRSK